MIQWWSFFLRDTVMILNKLITKHKGNVGFTANLFCSKQNVLARKITKKLLYYVVNTWYRLEQILNICFLKKRFWTFVIFMLGLRPARRKQTKLLLERSLGYPANQMVSRGERIWFVQWEQHSNLPIPLFLLMSPLSPHFPVRVVPHSSAPASHPFLHHRRRHDGIDALLLLPLPVASACDWKESYF
jgi:hypothetical protein